MQMMRDVLRNSLGRSLSALSPVDRLAAAWPVAAGHAIAERTSIVGLEEGDVTIAVPDAAWRQQLESMRLPLQGDLSRISRVPVSRILFQVPAAGVSRPADASAARRSSLKTQP